MKQRRNLIIIVIGTAVLLLVLGLGTLHLVGLNRLNRAPDIAGNPVPILSDAEAIERGRHLADITGCTSCHTANLSGQVGEDEPGLFLPIPNLTSGAGGVAGDYNDTSWELAVRHGVAADGRALLFLMPSHRYAHFSDADLADLIAFIKSAPPVDNDPGTLSVGFPITLIFGVLAYDELPIRRIDHNLVGGSAPESTMPVAYGEYLLSVGSCQDCHAENLAGNYGQLEGPLGPNLTQGGQLATWSITDFNTAMRTGLTPDGRLLSSDPKTGMPWPTYAHMTDNELQAIWSYLQSLDPLPDNQ